MGILNEMFGDGDKEQYTASGELLAKGSYESRSEEILSGYKIYRKKYVFSSLVWKILLVLLALASSVMMIMTAEDGKEIMPVFCLLISISVGAWFISQPINNMKKFRSGLEVLEGTVYDAEIYTDKIKISMVQTEPQEAVEAPPETMEQTEADLALDGENEEEEIPATVIHLDSPIVDLLDKENIFILVVKKAYVFIIPKRAFADEDIQKIKEKLSAIMGIRYKF